jgi:hypothetical protein
MMTKRNIRAIVTPVVLVLVGHAIGGAADIAWSPSKPNEIVFAPVEARFVRVTVLRVNQRAEACIDELEVYGESGGNLALAAKGAKASASSLLPGYAIHQIAHLNDGKYGNSHSWIAGAGGPQWAQIELAASAKINKVVFSRDREGRFRDRMPVALTVEVSSDGQAWKRVSERAVPLEALGRHGQQNPFSVVVMSTTSTATGTSSTRRPSRSASERSRAGCGRFWTTVITTFSLPAKRCVESNAGQT